MNPVTRIFVKVPPVGLVTLTIRESMIALAMNLPRNRNLERCFDSGPAFMFRPEANGKRPD